MAEQSLRADMQCTEDQYWAAFFSPEYNKELFFDCLKFPGYELLEQTEDETQIRRRVRITPPVAGLPGPVKKIVGDAFSYVEEGSFHKATKRFTFRVQPSVAADKTSTSGEMWCEVVGGKSVRCSKLKVDVKIFMVGGLVEDLILSNFKSSFDVATDFTNTYTARG